MALFEGMKPVEGTADQYVRSNTKLQVSTHDSPGEKFLVDPRLKRLFQYHFGGNGWVVIPKGRIVAPSTDNNGGIKNGNIKDFDGNVFRPVLTLANGGKDVVEIGKTGKEHTREANTPIGVSYANIYEEFVDGFNGMQPTIENEIYIELPYIPSRSDAEAVEWGSLYDADPTKRIKNGDYVISDENGRFIKADFETQREILKNTNASADDKFAALAEIARLQEQVLGQVWTVETNLPPQGWLGMLGWTDEQRAQDWNPNGMTADDIDDEFPGYPYERTYANTDVKSNRYYPQGIPGLTNGSNLEMPFEDILIGEINPGQKGRLDFRIQQTPVVAGSLVVKIDGQVVEPDYIDYKSGLVTLVVETNEGAAPQKVTATFKATGQTPGVPTGWDFKGAQGAVRILLQK